MKTISWLFKNVILPLAPFTIGAVIRLLHAGTVQWSCFSATELAFSIAMMFLILSGSTGKLTDPALKEALSSGCYLGVFVFLSLFATALFLEVDLANSLRTFLETGRLSTQSGQSILGSDLPANFDRFEAMLSRIRWTTMGLALASLFLAVLLGRKYDLMDT